MKNEDKRLAAEFGLIALILSMGVASMMSGNNIKMHLDIFEWSHNMTALDPKVIDDIEKQKKIIKDELMFGLAFIGGGTIWLLKIFWKYRKNLITLKEQNNHYKIKFLKGYGFSINVKDSKIILKNNHDPFSKPITEEWFVKDMPYDRIVLQGKGYISTESLSILSENNRTVILLDNRGNPVTFCNGMRDSLTATKYRIAQYDTFRDKTKRDYLTEQILKAKLESQIKFLKLTNSPDIQEGIKKLGRSGQSEAVSSRYYFDCYAKLIDERFEFTKRNSIRIEKKNATDVINALLNYGYSVLAGQISAYIHGVGLDAYYGFMHKNHTSFQSLVDELRNY